ncbi:MAG: MFS transporter [Thiobacillus sp.]|nr:MFS transporter [Thiobacillus sp.]
MTASTSSEASDIDPAPTGRKSRLPPVSLAWFTWGLLAGIYFVGFFQRVAPAVMVDELMRDFSISATMLGNLSAIYFYTYAAMQIPSGLLADAVGPRRVATAAAVVAAAGTIVFAQAESLWMASLGRGLIGASVAVAFVACMKLAGHWFPANRFATVTGISLLIGNFGGILAGMPLSAAIDSVGWRTAMLVGAGVTLVLAAAVWLWVRDDPSERGYASHAHPEALNNATLSPRRSLKRVVSVRDTWLLFFAGGLSAAPVLTFAGLWGVPYLMQVQGLDRSDAAGFTTAMLLGFAFGGPLLGALSDRMGRRKLPYLAAALVQAAGWASFLFIDNLSANTLYLLFATIGFSAGGLIIGFAFSREVNHPGAAGTVGGVVNMAVLGFAAIQQSTLGWILDRNWHGERLHGAPVYDAAAYHAAFLWLAISALAAVVFIALTRETYCRLRFDTNR